MRLSNFEGPFDLLLQLISQHELDVTEVALHQVTDDFIAHLRQAGDDWNLDETTEFLVVAATLLDLKAARLLPSGDVEDEDDLALLEARDLLFARLLQYRAYKQVAALFARAGGGRAAAVPEVGGAGGPLPGAAARGDAGREPQPASPSWRRRSSARSRRRRCPSTTCTWARCRSASTWRLLRVKLAEAGRATFGELVADCEHSIEVVARFLGLLDLYKENVILFQQEEALAELHVEWTGGTVEEAAAAAAAAPPATRRSTGERPSTQNRRPPGASHARAHADAAGRRRPDRLRAAARSREPSSR